MAGSVLKTISGVLACHGKLTLQQKAAFNAGHKGISDEKQKHTQP
jgi:hypothetical protein